MPTAEPIAPRALAEMLKRQSVRLIDIRETDEYSREHIAGACSKPLSTLATRTERESGAVVFNCKSGARTGANCERLMERCDGPVYILEGGLDAWKQHGLPTRRDADAPFELLRQEQIAAGALILTGVLLAYAVHPGFVLLTAFVGAGLTFAGVTGWRGMAKLLAVAPWNGRRPA